MHSKQSGETAIEIASGEHAGNVSDGQSKRWRECRRNVSSAALGRSRRSGQFGSLPIDDQVLSQKGALVPNDLRTHIRAVEVEVGAGVDLEFATRRVIRYLARQLRR
jgi:hypothetical protein